MWNAIHAQTKQIARASPRDRQTELSANRRHASSSNLIAHVCPGNLTGGRYPAVRVRRTLHHGGRAAPFLTHAAVAVVNRVQRYQNVYGMMFSSPAHVYRFERGTDRSRTCLCVRYHHILSCNRDRGMRTTDGPPRCTQNMTRLEPTWSREDRRRVKKNKDLCVNLVLRITRA